ncbi:hypothetical protein LTR36_002241 [Oleoguttula mirabilis]|uniref:FAD dependent oxidoreductase domain-containing protein n=1 Tax=Oleoguttula mirabilis TaxID=1507867 RepID=A0AAV9JLE5_9PEZI|nr:hypothetical protein LTR36_002241 [Oleoguttula mirabilis]
MPHANGTTNGGSSLRLPVPGSTKAFWHTELHDLADHRSTPELPKECEVLVIGSGYAGASVAYNLAKSASTLPNSIVILEARQACSGATGRNGGHLRPDLYGHIPNYIKRYGVEAGGEWAKFEIAHVQAIKKLVAEEDIDCDFTLTRTTDCWADEEAARKAKANYDLMTSLGLPYMEDVDFVYGPKAAGVSGVKDANASATYTAGTIFPYKFIMALLARALDSGKVNLQTNTPATAIHDDPAGGFVVETPRGSIKAKKIVHASNAYVSGLLPEYEKSIVPCKGVCVSITVPEGKTAPYLTNSYIVRDGDKVLSYLIPRDDGSIIVGGTAAIFYPHLEQWYNNTDDSTMIAASEGYYDSFMQRTFRGWEDSEASVSKAWTGVMGYSWDSLPHLGEVPGKPGQYVLAGFNGHGMPVIWLAAEGIAKMVATGKSYEDVGLPWIARTTEERLQKAQKGPEGGDILA